MRSLAVALTFLALGAGSALAQTLPAETPRETPGATKGASPTLPELGSASDTYAECMKLWEPATHMTRQEWARTCKRVQNRVNSVAN